MISTSYEPKGFKYLNSKMREVLFIMEGPWMGWIFLKHPDGFWVSQRPATEQDLSNIQKRIALGN
jgi:hypothetical protein